VLITIEFARVSKLGIAGDSRQFVKQLCDGEMLSTLFVGRSLIIHADSEIAEALRAPLWCDIMVCNIMITVSNDMIQMVLPSTATQADAESLIQLCKSYTSNRSRYFE